MFCDQWRKVPPSTCHPDGAQGPTGHDTFQISGLQVLTEVSSVLPWHLMSPQRSTKIFSFFPFGYTHLTVCQAMSTVPNQAGTAAGSSLVLRAQTITWAFRTRGQTLMNFIYWDRHRHHNVIRIWLLGFKLQQLQILQPITWLSQMHSFKAC